MSSMSLARSPATSSEMIPVVTGRAPASQQVFGNLLAAADWNAPVAQSGAQLVMAGQGPGEAEQLIGGFIQAALSTGDLRQRLGVLLVA